MRWSRFIGVLMLVALLSWPAAAAGAGARTLDRDLDPVIVLGQALPSFSGAPLGQLFVYAYRGGAWTQIPAQIDEVLNQQLVANGDGKLSANDQLVFMAADSGDQAPVGDWIADASSCSYRRYELTVSDPLDPAKQGWVYVYRSTTLTNTVTADYVSYDAPQLMVRSDRYELGWIRRRFGLDWLAMNGSGVNIMDRSKGRVELPPYGVYTEDAIEALLSAPILVRDGPVRVVVAERKGATELSLALGYRARLDYTGNLYSVLPSVPNSVRISLDKNSNASGSTYYDANTPAGVTVDGHPDSVAASPASQWFQVSHRTGTFIQVMGWSAGVASTYYKDDATIDAKDTGDKVSYGDCGFIIRTPGLRCVVSLTGYVLPPDQPNVGANYLAYIQHPLTVAAVEQTCGLEPTNTALATATSTRTPTRTATFTPTATASPTTRTTPSGTPTRTTTPAFRLWLPLLMK